MPSLAGGCSSTARRSTPAAARAWCAPASRCGCGWTGRDPRRDAPPARRDGLEDRPRRRRPGRGEQAGRPADGAARRRQRRAVRAGAAVGSLPVASHPRTPRRPPDRQGHLRTGPLRAARAPRERPWSRSSPTARRSASTSRWSTAIPSRPRAPGTTGWPGTKRPSCSVAPVSTTPEAKDAECDYRVVTTFVDASLIEVRLHTGRQGQIRAQAQLHGHSLVGDRRYRPREGAPGHRLALPETGAARAATRLRPSSGRASCRVHGADAGRPARLPRQAATPGAAGQGG